MDLLSRRRTWVVAVLLPALGLVSTCGPGELAGDDAMSSETEESPAIFPRARSGMPWIKPVLPDERVLARRRGAGDAGLEVRDPGDEYIVYVACDRSGPVSVRERNGGFSAKVACDGVVERTQVFAGDGGGALDIVVEAPTPVSWTLLVTRRLEGSR